MKKTTSSQMKWYKGNLHTHSARSDGDINLEGVIHWYATRGYDWLAITDHNRGLNPDLAAHLSHVHKNLVIPGNELTADGLGTVHVVGLGITEDSSRDIVSWKYVIEIDDPVIEKQYYLSLYGMGSCSRDLAFPPPLYGHDGGLYPVGIGPKGIEVSYNAKSFFELGPVKAEHRGLFFGQRSNGSYGLVNMAPRWYTTYDLDYGRKIYPIVLQKATFWQNYLTWDAARNRFIIENDSAHEGSGPDGNYIVSLALSRLAFELAKGNVRDAR